MNPFLNVLNYYTVSANPAEQYNMNGQIPGDICLVLKICAAEVDTGDFVAGNSAHKYVLDYLKSYGYSQLARVVEEDWSSKIESGH